MKANVRIANQNDGAAIAAIYKPFVTDTAISFELFPPSSDEMAARILKTLQRYPWLVCEVDKKIVGYAYGSLFRTRHAYQWTTEVSAYVDPKYQRLGLGGRLYRTLFRILIQQGFISALAGITLPNPGSVAFHESFGFTPVGVYHNVGYKMDVWYGVGWWEKRLQDLPKNPTDPQPFEIFREEREIDWSEVV